MLCPPPVDLPDPEMEPTSLTAGVPGTPELRYAVDAGAVGSTRESMVALASSSPGFHLPRTPKLRYAVDAGAWKRMESSSAARSPGPT